MGGGGGGAGREASSTLSAPRALPERWEGEERHTSRKRPFTVGNSINSRSCCRRAFCFRCVPEAVEQKEDENTDSGELIEPWPFAVDTGGEAERGGAVETTGVVVVVVVVVGVVLGWGSTPGGWVDAGEEVADVSSTTFFFVCFSSSWVFFFFFFFFGDDTACRNGEESKVENGGDGLSGFAEGGSGGGGG